MASLRPAIERAKQGTELHIFYVHGMGINPPNKKKPQEFDTSKEFRDHLCHPLHCTSTLNGRLYANEGHFAFKNGPPALSYLGDSVWDSTEEWRAAAPFVDNYTLKVRDTKAKIYLHEINWWPLILSAKCRLIVAPEAALVDRDQTHSSVCAAPAKSVDGRYLSFKWIKKKDIPQRNPPWRKAAVANRWLKHDILDWGFADALLAVGPLHKYLIEGIREAILQSFADSDNQEFVIVSHSLGSYLMFSALDLQNDPTSTPSTSQTNRPPLTADPQAPSADTIAEWRRRFHTLLTRTSNAYFMANQLRLLELANLDENQTGANPTPARSVGTHLNVWADARADAGQAPPRIVAFSDSDDFLTWQLPPQAGRNDPKGYFVCMEDRPANNAWQWPWLWLFANPMSAHLGYDKNKSVIDAMLAKTESNSGLNQSGGPGCQAQ